MNDVWTVVVNSNFSADYFDPDWMFVFTQTFSDSKEASDYFMNEAIQIYEKFQDDYGAENVDWITPISSNPARMVIFIRDRKTKSYEVISLKHDLVR